MIYFSVIEQDIEQEENKSQISADLRIRKTQVELFLEVNNMKHIDNYFLRPW